MKNILQARLVEGRLTLRAFWVAGGLWVLAVTLVALDMFGVNGNLPDGESTELGLLGALLAISSLLIAVLGVMVKMIRVEHEVTRIIAGVIRTEVRSSSRELREALANLDPVQVESEVGAEGCPFAALLLREGMRVGSVDRVPEQRNGSRLRRMQME